MCITPMSAMNALTCLPCLDLLVQGKARSAVHRLWSLGCWSYHLSIGGHSVVLMQIQRSGNIFSMESDIMRPAENFIWGYSANWRGMDERTCLVVKGLVWHTVGSKMEERSGAGVFWHSFGRAQYLPVKTYNSLPAQDTCYLGLCLWNLKDY